MSGESLTVNQYIVGIGASAGGMEAIHELFDNMSGGTGFSFVVVQHLSPDYKSLMAELLTRHTAMPVHEAVDGLRVEPNCIYVIPSNKLMTIRRNKLRLEEKSKSKLPNHAIDVFFQSLAEDRGAYAVGIVLSGTGTDGTKGILEIKNKGGIVVVQDPMSAAFDGMPNSALATGCADLILPPEVMGQELIDYINEGSWVRSFSALNEQEELLLRDILEYLHTKTKHNFAHYKRPTLLRRLAKRMSELAIWSLAEYYSYITTHDDEPRILCKEFLINVTRFFRDKEAFECLGKEVIPQIVSLKKNGEPIKIWVVACSSGEEAYSVAMLFLEYMEEHKMLHIPIKIFATDIDSEALETASRGLYDESIEEDVTQARLRKYFTREDSMYRVSVELRKLVIFANHDVLRDPPFSHLDLVTCRNVFIYLNPMLQRKVLKKFHFALNIDSFLMLGPSENIGVLKDVMAEINRKWKVYRCVTKSGSLDNDLIITPLDSKFYASPRMAKNEKSLQHNLVEIFKDTLAEDRKIAGIFIDKDCNVKHAIGSFKEFLDFPEASFNFNLLKLTPTGLAVPLGIAIRQAQSSNETVKLKHVWSSDGIHQRALRIVVKPYLLTREFQTPFLCIILEELPQEVKSIRPVAYDTVTSQERIEELERELLETRQNLQAVIEEIETANEELQSSNEEMISTNEELQSTNEELQSLNEELHTLSVEHQAKIKELIDLNDDLNNYFNNTNVGQILLDEKLIIRKFSPTVADMVNVIEADIGRSITDITTNFADVDFVNEVRRVLRNGSPREKEIRMSDDRFYLMRISPYVKRTKSAEGVVVTFTNITESKRLSSIIEGVFNSSTSGIIALKGERNGEGQITGFQYLTVNKSAEKMLNLQRDEIIGKSVVAPDHVRYSSTFRDVVETGRTAQFEFHQDAHDRWYNVVAVKMMDGLVATFTDITDKKRSEELIARNYEDLKVASQNLMNSNMQLERSNFDLLQFASVASHDLKEPLRKIQAFGNILQDKVGEKLSDSENNYLNKMISASGRMQTLIEDVLTLSKLSNNGLPHEKTDLNRIIKRICDDLEITIREKNAVISVTELPDLQAVPGQMRQLFQNLISNALKFSNKPQPVIRIAQKEISKEQEEALGIRAEDFVCIEVSDNGIGFEEQYREKIFGIFQRLHGRTYEGTGIGLAIAKKITENHGGHILANGVLNEGARFSIFLPLSIKHAQADLLAPLAVR
jgi:two-component system CheB/CheR fusion protein